MLWDVVWPDDPPDARRSRRASRAARRRARARRAAHAGPLARVLLLPRRRLRDACSPATRCSAAGPARPAAATATSRRSCARSAHAAGAARRDGRAHRPRRVDDDRRRARRRDRSGSRARHVVLSADSAASRRGVAACGDLVGDAVLGEERQLVGVGEQRRRPRAAGTSAHSPASASRTDAVGRPVDHGRLDVAAGSRRPRWRGSGTSRWCNGCSAPSSGFSPYEPVAGRLGDEVGQRLAQPSVSAPRR